MNELHVIVASHNRAATTRRALSSLDVAAAEADLSYDVTLFDDGSTDETVAEATAAVKNLTVLRGDGSAFWARSMAAAEDEVLSRDDVQDGDWLLWFNDDVVLTPSGLRNMVAAASALPAGVLVGSTVDGVSGLLTYGGLRRSGVHPLAFDLVEPPAAPDEGAKVDAFNGNVVLMPVHVARTVGAIDGAFSHAFADVDYGSRAVAKGVPIIVAGAWSASAAGTRPSCTAPRSLPGVRTPGARGPVIHAPSAGTSVDTALAPGGSSSRRRTVCGGCAPSGAPCDRGG